VRQLRALLRHRVQLVRLRTLLRNRIHAVLADHGYGRPAGCWSGPGRDWLASLPLPAASREVAGDGLALTGATEARTGRLDGEIRQRARPGPAGQGAHPAARRGAVHRAGHPG
jgi:transposase